MKTGKFADALSATRPKSTEEMAIVQREVDNVYSDFLRKVAEGRNQPAEHIAKIAEGRVWSGIDALELGLVDEMGGLEDAIAYAAEIAGLGEDPSIRDYPQVKNFFDELKENLNLNTSVRHSSPILDMIESTIDEIQSVSQFNDPKGVYAVLPYRIEAN